MNLINLVCALFLIMSPSVKRKIRLTKFELKLLNKSSLTRFSILENSLGQHQYEQGRFLRFSAHERITELNVSYIQDSRLSMVRN